MIGADRRVTSPCRDARSVRPLYQRLQRPSPLKVTASSWFDNGRSDRASLQGDVHAIKGYCVRCIKGYSVKLARQRTHRPCVPTGRRPRYWSYRWGNRLRRIVYLCREDPRLCRWVRSSDMLRAFCLFTSHAQSHESNSRHSP